MINYAEKFDAMYIEMQMNKLSISKKEAIQMLKNLKKFNHKSYINQLNEWFDSIHPY